MKVFLTLILGSPGSEDEMSLIAKIGLGLLGWLMWNVLLWGMAHEKADKKNKRFNFKKYKQTHIDDAVVSLVVGVPIIVWKNQFVWELILHTILKTEIPYDNIGYLGAGPLCQAMYLAVKWLFNLVQRFRNSPKEN